MGEMTMATLIPMANPNTGTEVPAYLGFSWTGLFFGPFVPLWRGHWSWFFILAIIAIPTFWGGAAIIAALIYNDKHKNYLMAKGYRQKNVGIHEQTG